MAFAFQAGQPESLRLVPLGCRLSLACARAQFVQVPERRSSRPVVLAAAGLVLGLSGLGLLMLRHGGGGGRITI